MQAVQKTQGGIRVNGERVARWAQASTKRNESPRALTTWQMRAHRRKAREGFYQYTRYCCDVGNHNVA